MLPSMNRLLIVPISAALFLSPLYAQSEDQLPPGVEQILPRGRIPAVSDPQFVSAEEAEIPDDAWVLGVVVGGVAKAYSLNLLNQHEVINDRSGDTAYAAVW